MRTGFTLDSNEKVLRRINFHWIYLAGVATMAGVMGGIGVLAALAYAMFPSTLPPFVPGWAVTILVVAFLIIGALIFVVGIWVYNRNYVLVTDHHLIHVEQHGLFHSQVDQVSLGRIQDVSGKRPGLLPTMLDFGQVTIQSAGEARQFIFNPVPDPQGLADYILARHEEFQRANPIESGVE